MKFLGIISLDLNINHLLVIPAFFIKCRINMIKVVQYFSYF